MLACVRCLAIKDYKKTEDAVTWVMFEMTQRSEAEKYNEWKVHRTWVVAWLQAWARRKGSYCATYFAYVVGGGRTTDEHNSQNHANAF